MADEAVDGAMLASVGGEPGPRGVSESRIYWACGLTGAPLPLMFLT